MRASTLVSPATGDRIGYGWTSIAVVFAATALAIGGGQYAFGVFVKPMEAEFGWTRTQMNGALSFSALSALAGPLVGRAMDRIGAKPIVASALVLTAISFLLRPFITQLWHLYALSALQFIGFAGATALPATRLAALWFPNMRGRMTGLASAGANFGGMLLPQLVSLILIAASWRWAYVALGVLGVGVLASSFFLIKEPQARQAHAESVPSGQGPDGGQAQTPGATVREALRSRSFYFLALAVLATGFAYQAVLTQIVPHLQNVGLPLARATAFLSLLAVFAMGGKVLFGYFTEKVPGKYILVFSLAVQSAGLLVMTTMYNTPLLWVMAPIYGVAYGGMGTVLPLLVQESFGLKHFGTVYGLVNLAGIGSSIVGPLMMGMFYDATGSYRIAFFTVIGIYAAGCACVLLTSPAYRAALAIQRKPTA